MSRRPLAAALLAIALPALASCSPTIKKPRLLGPGTAPQQRYNATQFDPYPLPDMGPEIVGGRPPDYLVPVPEVERANEFRDQHPPLTTPFIIPHAPVGIPIGSPAPIPAYPPATVPTTPSPVYRY